MILKKLKNLNFNIFILILSILMSFSCFKRISAPDISIKKEIKQLFIKKNSIKIFAAQSYMKTNQQGKKVEFDALILLKQPDKLRVEILDPFFNMQALMVINENKITFLDMQHQKVFIGTTSQDLLERLLPFNLKPETIVSLFLGTVPTNPSSSYSFLKTSSNNHWIFEHSNGSIFKIDPISLQVIEILKEDLSGKKVKVEYEKFSNNSGYDFASKIKAINTKGKESLEIDYRGVHFNPKVKDESFTIKVPDNFSIEYL